MGCSRLKTYLVHLFSVAGGGERVSFEIARALRDKGIKVVYVTNSAKALRDIAEFLGYPGEYESIEVGSGLEKILRHTGRFVRYRKLLLLEKMNEKLASLREEKDAILIDTGTNHLLDVDVSYLHDPFIMFKATARSTLRLLYNKLMERKINKITRAPRLVLTNSTWSAKIFKETLGLEPVVVYPPVDIDYFRYDGRSKEKIIVTVARFTPDKNLHLLPEIAHRIRDYEWHLVGSTGSTSSERRISRQVLARIKEKVDELGARNLHIQPDLPRAELRELLLRARFYIHPPFPEYFGIAVAEAISAGCIPIVYRDGGAWFDIVSQIDESLGYTRLEEIPAVVYRLENESSRLNKLVDKATRYISRFSPQVFREKFIEILMNYMSRTPV